MNYAILKQAHTDWLATSPDPQTDAAFLAWLAESVNVNRASISGDEMFQQTDPAEFAALVDHDQQMWVSFTSRASVDPFAANNVAFVKSIFGATATTVSNLAAARVTTQTRAASLGLGTVGQPHLDRLRLDGGIE